MWAEFGKAVGGSFELLIVSGTDRFCGPKSPLKFLIRGVMGGHFMRKFGPGSATNRLLPYKSKCLSLSQDRPRRKEKKNVLDPVTK